MKHIEKPNKVFLIRKSFIDETTELARCSDLELALCFCKPGYNIYDEEGSLLHTTVEENKTKHDKLWSQLKSKVEQQVMFVSERRLPIIAGKEVEYIFNNLNEILQLMNQIEVESTK